MTRDATTRTGARPRPPATVAPVVAGAAISALVALVVGLAVSCGPSPGGDGAAAAQDSAQESGPRTPSPAGAAAPADPPGYSPLEPVLGASFADPTVIKVGETYFAYGTNNADAAMPVATAPSPTGPWRRSPGDGLAHLPAWAAEGWTWAPEVVPPGGGSDAYVLYFTARRRDSRHQCIGAATASSPAGPFVPLKGGPLVCPLNLGGAIDAASYVETDGTRYLLYKTDGREKAAIHLVRLNPDGLGLAGPPKRIMGRGAGEPVLVEAPDLVRRGGRYVLFYSAGWYFQPNYQTRYAVASSIEGPYEKAAAPLQSTAGYGGRIEGPGSADVLTDESGDYLVFHGILDYHGGSRVSRAMYVARLGWDGARPVVRGVPVRYEAERARLNGCVPEAERRDASGGAVIGPFARDACRMDVPVFAPAAGRYSLTARHTAHSGDAAPSGGGARSAARSGSESHLELSVNGRAATSLRLSATGAGWSSATVEVELSAGWNTLGLRRLGGGREQIDYFELR